MLNHKGKAILGGEGEQAAETVMAIAGVCGQHLAYGRMNHAAFAHAARAAKSVPVKQRLNGCCVTPCVQVCISAQLHSQHNDASGSSRAAPAAARSPAGKSGRRGSKGSGGASSSSRSSSAFAGGEAEYSKAPVSKGSGAAPWVQLLIIHTGLLAVDRLHSPSQQLTAAAAASTASSSALRRPRMPSGHGAAPSTTAGAAAATVAAGAVTAARLAGTQAAGGAPASAAPRPRRAAGTAALSGGSRAASASGTWPAMPGSGLVSFAMAEQLVQAVGGRVLVSPQVPMVNASSGGVESATCIEVLLPGCAA